MEIPLPPVSSGDYHCTTAELYVMANTIWLRLTAGLGGSVVRVNEYDFDGLYRDSLSVRVVYMYHTKTGFVRHFVSASSRANHKKRKKWELPVSVQPLLYIRLRMRHIPELC